jgi:bacterioferritin B
MTSDGSNSSPPFTLHVRTGRLGPPRVPANLCPRSFFVPTPEMSAALNVHMGREFAAHFQYLSLASYFDGEGLPELAGFFFAQADEEHVHAMKFLRYILDSGADVAIPAIPAAATGFTSADDAVGRALEWEMAVTAQINDLVHMAVDQRDIATQAFLQWFVTEQVEEVATMTELGQVVRRAGEPGLLQVEDYVVRKAARAAEGPATAE